MAPHPERETSNPSFFSLSISYDSLSQFGFLAPQTLRAHKSERTVALLHFTDEETGALQETNSALSHTSENIDHPKVQIS